MPRSLAQRDKERMSLARRKKPKIPIWPERVYIRIWANGESMDVERTPEECASTNETITVGIYKLVGMMTVQNITVATPTIAEKGA